MAKTTGSNPVEPIEPPFSRRDCFIPKMPFRACPQGTKEGGVFDPTPGRVRIMPEQDMQGDLHLKLVPGTGTRFGFESG